MCENHHVAAAYNLLKQKPLNIFENLSKDEYKIMRKWIVSMVLATDMAKHFPDLNKLNTMVKAEDFLVNTMSEEDKIFFMSMSVHMADLSNPTKEWLIGLKWAILLYEEFFTQGNTEKKLGIPVGNLTDKPNVNIAKQQVGFMKAIV